MKTPGKKSNTDRASAPDNGRVAIWTYGKFDPPCAADDKLFEAMIAVRNAVATEWYGAIDLMVFPSRVENKDSVLTADLRQHYVKKAFADYGRTIDAEQAKDPFKTLDYLVTDLGYKHLVAVFPADTAKKLKDLVKYTNDATMFRIEPVDLSAVPGNLSVGALLDAADRNETSAFVAASPAGLRHMRDFMTIVRNGLLRVQASTKKAT